MKVNSGDGLMLFTQGKQVPELVIADSAVEVGESGCVTVVVENHGGEVVRLSEGEWLGEVTPVEVVETRENGGKERVVRQLELSPKEAEGRTKRLLEQLQLQLNRLGEEDKVKLASILCSYSDVFALTSSELGATSITRHSIDTGGHSPIHQPLRRMPFALRPQVDKMVHEMLDQGVIQHSSSPWSSPVVLVKKKDNSMRFCVDYRRLNSITKLDEYPLPRIDDTLDILAGCKYFTTLDLASGYWQVAMEPAAQEKTAFTTYSGHYEFCCMPFGLANAPATFQRLMEVVLRGLVRRSCLVYLDDVLVVGSTLEEHNKNLAEVLE